MLEELIHRCQSLEFNASSLETSDLSDNCKRRLWRLLKREALFLSSMRNGTISSTESRVKSTNLNHLEALVDVLHNPSIKAVSALMQSIPGQYRRRHRSKFVKNMMNSEGQTQAQEEMEAEAAHAVHVDMVCLYKGQAAWVHISAQNPRRLVYSEKDHQHNLKTRVQHLLSMAKEGAEELRPGVLLLVFAVGLSDEISARLVDDFSAEILHIERQKNLSQASSPVNNANLIEAPGHSSATSMEDRFLSENLASCMDDLERHSDNLLPPGSVHGKSKRDDSQLASLDLPSCLEVEDGDWVNIINEGAIEFSDKLPLDGVQAVSGSSRSVWCLIHVEHDTLGAAGKSDLPQVAMEIPERFSLQTSTRINRAVLGGMCKGVVPNGDDLSKCRELCGSNVSENGSIELPRSEGNNSEGESADSNNQYPARNSFMSPVRSSKRELLNMDTTALIAMTSQISNGGAAELARMDPAVLQRRFRGMKDFVLKQVASELEQPLVPEIEALLCEREGIVCDSAVREFSSIVALVGGPQEKQRAAVLLSRLRRVPDAISQRIAAMRPTGRIKARQQVVFGTGETWHATTLSASMAFVRAAMQAGMPIDVIEHRPRAFIGD